MGDEIQTFKGLQAALNASFETIFTSSDGSEKSKAKEQLIGLGHALAATAAGPAFSIIGLSMTPLVYMTIRIAVDLNLFTLIAEKPRTLDELAAETKADKRLLRRIARVVAAHGYLQQTQPDTWEASPLTHAVTIPALRNWIIAHFDGRMDTYTAYPAWLREHEHQTSWQDDQDNIWSKVLVGDCWSWMKERPDYAAAFHSAMSLQEQFPPEMTPDYPFSSTQVSEMKSDRATLVDVGGGKGQAIQAIRATYPKLTGEFILQDLPENVAEISKEQQAELGLTAQPHDFFQPQPVKGAKYYHLRRVLHDWNDESSLKILAALKPALEAGYSKLLIVEFVLADVAPGPGETSIDIVMMMSCDGCERSLSEWRELLGKAGLKIDQVIRAQSGATACIEASLA